MAGKTDQGNQIFSDLDIQALVDGALPAEEQIRLLKAIENSPEALLQLQKLEQQKNMLRRWYGGHGKPS